MAHNPPPYPVQNAKFRAAEALRQAQLITAERLKTIGTSIDNLNNRSTPLDGEKAIAELNAALSAILRELKESRSEIGRIGTAIEQLCKSEHRAPAAPDDAAATATVRNKRSSAKEGPPEGA